MMASEAAKQSKDDVNGVEASKKHSASNEAVPSYEKCMNMMKNGEWALLETWLRHISKFEPDINAIDEECGLTPFIFAIKETRFLIAERLLELGATINQSLPDGQTALHYAVVSGKEDIVRSLLRRNADATVATTKFQLALHLACGKPTVPIGIVQMLLRSSGKDARLFRDSEGCIPLFYAIKALNYNVCKELLLSHVEDQLQNTTNAKRNTALHLACMSKDTEMIKLLIDSGADVDVVNSDGQTPLHISSWEGDENSVKFFYNCKANANITDNLDRTPLHVAAERGQNKVIEVLIDKFKCNYSLRTKDGSTLMHIASECGHQSTALLFLKKGVPLHMPNKAGAICLHSACKKGHVAVVKALLQKGAQIDARTKDNYTPLHVAVENCKYLVVQMLLGYGADVQIRGGKAKETPLHIAAKISDSEKCAEMLLKSGADPNITEENGETALHIACRHGHLKLVRILLVDGASPIFQSNNGETALHIAVRFCYFKIVKTILEFVEFNMSRLDAVILVNTPNQEGETAVHYSAEIERNQLRNEFDEIDILNLLLNYGGDVNFHAKLTHETAIHYCASSGNINILWEIVKKIELDKLQIAINKQSKYGWSPLLVAAEKGHTDMVRLLLQYNARSDIFEDNGKSALHLASECGQCDVVDLLLDRKAFINAKTKNGFTALHLACQNGHTELVKLLIERGSDADALTLTKKTPLHLAAQHGQIDVCNIVLKLKKNVSALLDATDSKGQSPIHLAAENDHAQIVKLFLKHQPALAKMASSFNGNTCAHIAAMKGSVEVLKELMKFNKPIVINAHNKTNDSTCLHLASAGGHKDVVKLLIEAGANPFEENKEGMTAIHLAARYGHIEILHVLKDFMELNYCSVKTGLTALHIAAFYGQTDFCREMLIQVPANIGSEKPDGNQKLGDIKLEPGLTPLHLSAVSGHEGLIRLLLNSQNVMVDAASQKTEAIALHFAAENGHIAAVGLLLSKYTAQIHVKNKMGRTALHLAAANGHYEMVSVLIGQGANINLSDKTGWTALHYASLKGHLNGKFIHLDNLKITFSTRALHLVVKLLVDSGAPTTCETNEGKIPLCNAASNRHIAVLEFLLTKKHDVYSLLEDQKFLMDLLECGKLNNKETLRQLILVSPAPVDIAAKLSASYRFMSEKEKEIARELIDVSDFCEEISAELVSIVASLKNIETLLKSVDMHGVQFVDVLVDCNQKKVISHFAVQQYFSDLWDNNLKMSSFKMLLIFLFMLFVPIVWCILALPLPIRLTRGGLIINRVPIIKFICFVISHLYFIVLLYLAAVQPITPITTMDTSEPYYHEWLLLAWISGLLAAELSSPSDKSGLGVLKIIVIICATIACVFHVITFLIDSSANARYELFYARNVLFALTLLVSSVQLLDFLTFHYLFGPWAIIIRQLMLDLLRFLVILSIFLLGFSCLVTAVYQDVYPDPNNTAAPSGIDPTNSLKSPLIALELLFFALFGLVDPTDLPTLSRSPMISLYIQKAVFGCFLVIAVIVLINCLIAMMASTYQRIEAQSDIEWKYGRAKLIRNMTKTNSNVPTPFILLTRFLKVASGLIKYKGAIFNAQLVLYIDEIENFDQQDITNSQIAENMDQLMSKKRKSQAVLESGFNLLKYNDTPNKIEHIIDWKKIVKNYLKIQGLETDKDGDEDAGNVDLEL